MATLSAVTIKARIEEQWANRSIKTDWLGLEDVLRSTLDSQEISAQDKVVLAREAVAAYTGRG